jgi:MYXO-CTERM domain-containing protein
VCAATSNCPSGYECTGGFCFADPPMVTKSGDPKNSTGCGCTTASSSSPWAGVGFLTLGLLAFKRRRR